MCFCKKGNQMPQREKPRADRYLEMLRFSSPGFELELEYERLGDEVVPLFTCMAEVWS